MEDFMLKNNIIKRFLLCLSCLFIIFIIYLFPVKDKQVISREYKNNLESIIYLKNRNNYISRVTVYIPQKDQKEVIKEIIQYLTIGSNNSNYIKEGFYSIIPKNTKLLSIDIIDNLVKLNFSKEFLNVPQDDEENMISAIIYSITSFSNIKKVSIYINNEQLDKLPKSGIALPSILDRSFGINKTYDFTKPNGTVKTTIYYLSKENDYYYYIPVTLINNYSKDKLEIIIKELSSKNSYQTGIISYINNIKKMSYVIEDNTVKINIDKALFDILNSNNTLETVIYSMNLSIEENINAKEVIYLVDNYIYEKFFL